MFNEHSQQENTREQSKKNRLLPKATLPVVPELQEISDEELDYATGGSEEIGDYSGRFGPGQGPG